MLSQYAIEQDIILCNAHDVFLRQVAYACGAMCTYTHTHIDIIHI